MRECVRAAWVFWGVAMLLLNTGCTSWFLREDQGLLPEATLEEVRNGLERRTRGVLSLKALMAIRVMGSQHLTASLVWEAPRQFRFRGFDPLGRTLFEVVVAGDLVQWSVPGRPPVLLGTVESLAQSASMEAGRLPIAIEDLVRVASALTGPVLKGEELPVMERPPGPFYLVHAVIPEAEQARLVKRFWVDRQWLRLVREEFFHPEGFPDLVLDFSEYRATAQGDWPHRVTVLKTKEDRSIEVIFQELKFNIPVAPEEFRLAEGAIP